MIIDIYRENCDFEIRDLPYRRFPGHEVCVANLCVMLSEAINDTFVILSSSMVDCSAFNPEQQLLSFYNASYYMESKALVCQPTQLSWYKLQCHNIPKSFFELHLEKPNENLKIEKIYIQLEARKECKASAWH